MSYSLSPWLKPRFFITGTNRPLAGGLMYTYKAGTTDPAKTYSDDTGTENTNPIQLDSDGQCDLFLDDAVSYRIILKNSAGVTQFDKDRIASLGSTQVQSFNSIAALRLRSGTTIANAAKTLGYYSAGDGGGNSFYWDSTSVATDNGGTVIKPTAVSGAGRWLAVDTSINVKQFGAVGNVVAGDAPAVSAAIAAAFASGGNTVFFPDGIYYFAAPVTVVFDTFRSLRLVGTSSAGCTDVRPGGTRITGASGIESLFLFRKTNLTVPGGYAFECTNIDFYGNSNVLSAIKNVVGGYPARPFVVRNCNFTGFSKAISSDITASGLETGICDVSITECNFNGNTLALYGKGLGAIMNLDFSGNVCEQNVAGGIFTEALGATGTWRVCDNLLEGQINPIVINAGKIAIDVSRNYFELNTGALISVNCEVSSSSATVADNFIYNCSGTYASFNNLLLNSNQDFKIASVKLRLGTSGKSRIGNRGIVNSAATASPNFCLDVNSVPMRSAVPSNVLTGAYTTGATTKMDTPAGSLGVEAVNGSGRMYTMTGTVATGDKIVVMALARVKGGTSATAYISCFDSSNTYIGNTEPTADIGPCGQDEWIFVCRILKVSGPSTGTFKFVWVTGANIEFSDSYVYTVASPTDATDYPVFMPSSGLVSADQLLGRFFPQTSASGTTSIVDTGIFRTTEGVGYGLAAIYDVFVTGFQNAGANVYKTIVAGIIAVGTGSSGSEIFYSELLKPNFTGVAEFTVSAVFWDGTTESATASDSSTTHQIRLKVDGYNASYVGYLQVVRLVRRL